MFWLFLPVPSAIRMRLRTGFRLHGIDRLGLRQWRECVNSRMGTSWIPTYTGMAGWTRHNIWLFSYALRKLMADAVPVVGVVDRVCGLPLL